MIRNCFPQKLSPASSSKPFWLFTCFLQRMKLKSFSPSGFVLLSVIIFSGVIIQAQTSFPPRWVNGILGGSVLLPLDGTPDRIYETEWRFSSGGQVRLGVSKYKTFNEFNFSTRFHQRLQMYNETTLRVDGLQMNDTGTFQAHITSKTGYVVKQDFHLTVYEPVPTPEIRNVTSSRDGWVITLECRVSPSAAVNITWIETLPAHVEELQQHWLTSNRSSENISLNCREDDRPLFCVASNPADMKSVSLNKSDVCPEKGGNVASRTLVYILLLVLFAALIVILLTIFYWKKKKRKWEASASSNPAPRSSSGVEYASIQRAPPEGNDQMHANLETSPIELKTQPRRVQTVYDEVRFVPKERSTEVI